MGVWKCGVAFVVITPKSPLTEMEVPVRVSSIDWIELFNHLQRTIIISLLKSYNRLKKNSQKTQIWIYNEGDSFEYKYRITLDELTRC